MLGAGVPGAPSSSSFVYRMQGQIVQAAERADLSALLDHAADLIARHVDLAALAALAGTSVGIVVAFMVIASFMRTVGFVLRQHAISLTIPSLAECIWYGLISALTIAATALLAAVCAAWIAARRQPWTLLRSDAP